MVEFTREFQSLMLGRLVVVERVRVAVRADGKMVRSGLGEETPYVLVVTDVGGHVQVCDLDGERLPHVAWMVAETVPSKIVRYVLDTWEGMQIVGGSTLAQCDLIQNKDIRALRAEARAVGDEAQVRTCDRALGGDAWARSLCLMAVKAWMRTKRETEA